MKLESDVTWFEEGIGRIKVWLDDDPEETYLDAVVAHKKDLSEWMGEQGWFGLSKYARSIRGKQPVVYLVFMGVREDLGGQGIGTAMLRRALEISQELGARKVLLQRDSNSRSPDQALARLYKRVGFVDVDVDNEDEDDPIPAMELSL